MYRYRLSNDISVEDRNARVEKVIQALGLVKCADTKVGTQLIRGVSGGERRRCSIATQLIRLPPLIFLDEPTSGLDSAASFKIITYINQLAKELGLVVVATIHQPSSETFNLFDKLLLIANGKPMYFGGLNLAPSYFEGIGYPVPQYMNPADFYLSEINVDFHEQEEAVKTINAFSKAWEFSSLRSELFNRLESYLVKAEVNEEDEDERPTLDSDSYPQSFTSQTLILIERSLVNGRRNILAYWIRIAMYGI